MATYKVIRLFFNGPNKVLLKGLTLADAQEFCSEANSSSRTTTSKEGKERTKKYGPWFNGYTEE
jgi:hypothetical protein